MLSLLGRHHPAVWMGLTQGCAIRLIHYLFCCGWASGRVQCLALRNTASLTVFRVSDVHTHSAGTAQEWGPRTAACTCQLPWPGSPWSIGRAQDPVCSMCAQHAVWLVLLFQGLRSEGLSAVGILLLSAKSVFAEMLCRHWVSLEVPT